MDEIRKSSVDFGWSEPANKTHDWSTLRANVQNYIKKMNFAYTGALSDENIDYINAKASFKDANTVTFDYAGLFINEDPVPYDLKARNFLIAVGGRPRAHPAIPADIAITSDDLFSLDRDPGTTLVVGGGYIAVECAGFLKGLGKEVYLANRSSFLRMMDGDMAEKITEELMDEGVRAMK